MNEFVTKEEQEVVDRYITEDAKAYQELYIKPVQAAEAKLEFIKEESLGAYRTESEKIRSRFFAEMRSLAKGEELSKEGSVPECVHMSRSEFRTDRQEWVTWCVKCGKHEEG